MRGEPLPPPARTPRGTPFSRRPDWGKIALFGGGLALGVLLGAGTALLTAPYSGLETRTRLRRRARRMRHDAVDRWDELRDELRDAARDARHRLGQRVHRQANGNGADWDD